MHYNFIEIGTSDFQTLIQKASPETIGLSVEPLDEYLDRLPNKPNVTKVNAAISNIDGELDIFYIPLEEIKNHNLPYWVKGSNKIGGYHHMVVRELEKRDLPISIYKSKKVPVLSIEKLFSDYNVESVDLLKIDTEGHDPIILHAYLDLIDKNQNLKARQINFETNSLSTIQSRKEIIERLQTYGYTVQKGNSNSIATLN